MNKSSAIPSSIPSLDDLANAAVPEDTQVRRRTRAEQQRLVVDDACDEQTTAYTVPPELLAKIRSQQGGPSLQRLLELDGDDDVTLAYDAVESTPSATHASSQPEATELATTPAAHPLAGLPLEAAPAEAKARTPSPAPPAQLDDVTNPGLRRSAPQPPRAHSGWNRFLLAITGLLLLTTGVLLGLLMRP